MVALAVGLQAQFEKPIRQLGLLNEVEVRPARPPQEKSGGKEGSNAVPVLDDQALEKFERLPGVVYAYPDFRLSQVTVSRGDSSRQVLAVGLPGEAGLIGVFNGLLVAGDYFTLGSDSQVLLAEKMSGELGFASPQAAVGETLTIAAAGLDATATGQFEMRRQQVEVRIVGVYRARG